MDINLDLSKVITEGKDCPKCGSFHCEEQSIYPCENFPFGFTWKECLDCGEVWDF
jgi:hypothetical protein